MKSARVRKIVIKFSVLSKGKNTEKVLRKAIESLMSGNINAVIKITETNSKWATFYLRK